MLSKEIKGTFNNTASIPIKEQLLFNFYNAKNELYTASIPIKEQLL